MANTTWNPSDLVAVTLSGGNLVATATASTGGVRAIAAAKTGKYYWEVTTNVATGGNTSLGYANGAANLSTLGPTPTGGALIYRSGSIWINNVNTGIQLSGTFAGNVTCVACDIGGQLIWFRQSAVGSWNNNVSANPATGVGGLSIASIGGGGTTNLYPVATFNIGSDQWTANFGDSAFTGAVPAGFTSGFGTSALATQVALEEFAFANPPAQVTQVSFEHWVTTATITGQALVTQVALEQWVPAPKLTVELAGNLGGASHYGILKYGLKQYSRINAFAPLFSADLDIRISLIELGGGLAPQIALGGSLSLSLPLTALDGSFGFSVVLGASGLVSGPLWVTEEPVAPPWTQSEPCPVPPWMMAPPCDPIVWSKSRMCNG